MSPFALFLTLLAVPSLAARIKHKAGDIMKNDNAPAEPTGPNTKNASKPAFEMPTFDQLARVRADRLTEIGINEKAAEKAIQHSSTGDWINGSMGAFSFVAQRGIVQADWQVVGPKLGAFRKYSAQREEHDMDFQEFVAMTNRDPAFAAYVTKTSADLFKEKPFPTSRTDVGHVAQWLWDCFGYWTRFSGKTLAKDFIETGAELQELIAFASLDKDQKANLDFGEAYSALPNDESQPELAWSNVAMVEDTDFASLHIWSAMTKSILSMCHDDERDLTKDACSQEDWNTLNLQGTLTEFVNRDTRPRSEGDSEKFQGSLKFYQIADILPHDQVLDSSNNFEEVIDGEKTSIHVPKFEEVIAKGGRADIMPEDVEHWLKKAEQGMENSWFFWTDKNAHAKNMASDVVRWGDGTIQGVARGGFQNGRITTKGHDQFADVAPRLALFVALNKEHDGNIDFATAHKYLKAHLNA